MREIHRVLFVRTDRMGDVLMNLPAVRLLRQTFPKAWLTFLCDKSVAPLLEGHPDLDEVMAVDAATLKSGFGPKKKLIDAVRRAKFDLAVVSNPDKFLHALVFAAHVPHRVGYARKWGFLLTKSMPDEKSGGRHEIDLNLELASLASDKAWDGTLALPEDEGAKKRVESLLVGVATPLVALHPGTSNPKKRWPEERFAELASRLSLEGCAVAFVGGAEEAPVSDRIAKAAGVRALDLTGKLSLRELAALFQSGRVQTLVSTDSGPVHVAWMAGTPAVALYAKDAVGSDPRRWGPRDRKSRTVWKPMADISVEEVLCLVRETGSAR